MYPESSTCDIFYPVQEEKGEESPERDGRESPRLTLSPAQFLLTAPTSHGELTQSFLTLPCYL